MSRLSVVLGAIKAEIEKLRVESVRCLLGDYSVSGKDIELLRCHNALTGRVIDLIDRNMEQEPPARSAEEVSASIEMIIKNFDFETMHSYMVLHRWSWFSQGGVPPVAALKQCARDLLLSVSKETGTRSTGGFLAVNLGGSLQLYFTPCSADDGVGA